MGDTALQIFVTVPEGEDDLSQFQLIERSLTGAYGGTREAPVQVKAIACDDLQPEGGLAADAPDLARGGAECVQPAGEYQTADV